MGFLIGIRIANSDPDPEEQNQPNKRRKINCEDQKKYEN
jgi:hypothetical protein